MNPPLQRLKALRSALQSQGLKGFIVSKKENIHYLTGLSPVHPTQREALLFITPTTWQLYHSPFLIPTTFHDLKLVPMNRTNALEKLLTQTFQASPVGIEATDLTVAEFRRFATVLKTVKLVATHRLIAAARQIKDSQEIKHLTAAGQLARRTMRWLGIYLKENAGKTTEKQLSHAIEARMKKIGADQVSFPLIVAAGANAADPHHQPNDTPITHNSAVLVDLGCQVSGYHSDKTRTFYLGEPPAEFKRLRSVVKQAYTRAVKALEQPSTTAALIDRAARDHIAQAGFKDFFIHTTGHGLGLEIHEPPSLNDHNQEVLKPGMVVTVEPGIYLRGKFGYRHEDTFLLTRTGPKKLT